MYALRKHKRELVNNLHSGIQPGGDIGRSARPADIFRVQWGRVGPGSHYCKRGRDGLGIYVLGARYLG